VRKNCDEDLILRREKLFFPEILCTLILFDLQFLSSSIKIFLDIFMTKIRHKPNLSKKIDNINFMKLGNPCKAERKVGRGKCVLLLFFLFQKRGLIIFTFLMTKVNYQKKP